MKVDLHNHTPRCNHAKGDEREYIEKAIENKTLFFGFSDHAPMNFDLQYRMDFSQMEEYESTIKNLSREYADKITILLGYEVDYIPEHIDKRVLQADVDYLIGSVHFLDKWGFDNPEFLDGYKKRDIDEIWRKYFEFVANMAQTGLFDIVGHIDLIKVFQFMPKEDFMIYAKTALEAIKKADMAIEINTAGYRKPCSEPYPSKEILAEAFKMGIPITFGSDAHKPQQVALYSQDVEHLAKEVGYTRCAVYKKRQREMIAF